MKRIICVLTALLLMFTLWGPTAAEGEDTLPREDGTRRLPNLPTA